jgi:ribosomal protein L35AE/L33A
MTTITGAAFDEDKYRTQITSPSENLLHGNVTVTLIDLPKGQPKFRVGQDIIVKKHEVGRTMKGTIHRVDGPTKYAIVGLH